MDFLQRLDPSKAILANLALSFISSPFTTPQYNLPISLFGAYAIEATEAVQSLQIFLVLISTSPIWDIVFMARHEMNGFMKFLTILNLIVKILVALSVLMTLRQRGAQFAGLRSADINGPTLWAMPGGFSSNREGYQSVDEEPTFERPHVPSRGVNPPAPPPVPAPNQPQAKPAPGAYQSV